MIRVNFSALLKIRECTLLWFETIRGYNGKLLTDVIRAHVHNTGTTVSVSNVFLLTG